MSICIRYSYMSGDGVSAPGCHIFLWYAFLICQAVCMKHRCEETDDHYSHGWCTLLVR